MGLFGRLEAKEKAQFTASYNKWFDLMYQSECRSRGVPHLSAEVMQEVHRVAINQAASDTYKVGQRIRVTDFEIQALFTGQVQSKTMDSIRRIAAGQGKHS